MNNPKNLFTSSNLLVILTSIVVVVGFILPWETTTYGGGLAFTGSGYAVASRGLSDQYAYLHWLYYLPVVVALLCGALSLMFIKRRSPLPISIFQVILTIIGLLPFILFFIEIKWMNQWGISYTEPRLGLWVSALGLIGILLILLKDLVAILQENGGWK